jgi:hypothetical protein
MSYDSENSPIQWKWVFFSIIVFFILQAILSVVFGIFGVITLGIGFILFRVITLGIGFILFIFIKPIVYFLGGIVTGYFSPGITLKEPAIGAIIVTILGVLFESGRFGFGRLIWMIITGVISYILAIAGASMGEKLQQNK